MLNVEGMIFSYIKFYGRLYCMIKDYLEIGDVCMRVVKIFNVLFVGLFGILYEMFCEKYGVFFILEFFLDFWYDDEG